MIGLSPALPPAPPYARRGLQFELIVSTNLGSPIISMSRFFDLQPLSQRGLRLILHLVSFLGKGTHFFLIFRAFRITSLRSGFLLFFTLEEISLLFTHSSERGWGVPLARHNRGTIVPLGAVVAGLQTGVSEFSIVPNPLPAEDALRRQYQAERKRRNHHFPDCADRKRLQPLLRERLEISAQTDASERQQERPARKIR